MIQLGQLSLQIGAFLLGHAAHVGIRRRIGDQGFGFLQLVLRRAIGARGFDHRLPVRHVRG